MTIYDINQLASYVDALRPIIYINHFDAYAIDKMIRSISDGRTIYEYNLANGFVNFETKQCETNYQLDEFLALFEGPICNNAFIVLKDIHAYLEDPLIVSKLKNLALRTVYNENFDSTIFIVSSKLMIPIELRHLITVFGIPLPSIDEIRSYVEEYAEEFSINIKETFVDDLALSLKGFSEFEIRQILNLAYQNSGSIDESDKIIINQEKEQIIKKSGMLEHIPIKEKIEDIGGLDELKVWLKQKSIVFKNLDDALRFGVDIPRGIIIVGMPGCGKSLTAKATADLFNVPLIRLDVGKLLGKYVGESEENLRYAISIAEAVSPCVLWIDEIEKAFGGITKSGDQHEVTQRLVGHFLTWLQEKQSVVFIVATSNDISKLPPEFCRKGRFDDVFCVSLPNKEERFRILSIHLDKRLKKRSKKDIDLFQLLNETNDFSGADLEYVVTDAIEHAFVHEKEKVTTQDLIESIARCNRVAGINRKEMDEIQKQSEERKFRSASSK